MIIFIYFFFNDTATTEIYTLSLHDALPIWSPKIVENICFPATFEVRMPFTFSMTNTAGANSLMTWRYSRYRKCRSEEHTSELQSRQYLVCRLLLEKKYKSHS